MTTSIAKASIDLTNCDREPVHIPGSIQSHGVLLVLKEPELTLLQVSENVHEMFGIPAESVLNKHVSHLLEPSQVDILRKVLLSEDIQMANPIKLHAKAGTRELHLDGIVHRRDGLLLLELEQAILQGERILCRTLPTHQSLADPAATLYRSASALPGRGRRNSQNDRL
jgi:two-component system, chemotaxis family, sensor kinase Cph1